MRRKSWGLVRVSAWNLAAVALVPVAMPVLAASVIQFSAASYHVSEGMSQVQIPVRRTGALDTIAGVQVATTNGTAISSQDYAELSANLQFLPGESNKVVTLTILNDGMVEPVETFQVLLNNPTDGAELGTRQSATVRITDNDQGLHLELGTYSVNEDSGKLQLRVVRRDDGDFPVSVDYATTTVTATPGEDYREVTGTLTFAPGDVVQTVTVPILNDTIRELNETFRISLSNPTGGGVLGTVNAATVTITDTDETVWFESASYSVPEDAAFVQIVLLRGENGSTGTADLATANGTAISGVDYETVAETVRYEAGERRKEIRIPIQNDDLREARESFRITLSNPSGAAALGSPSTTTINILDNDPGISFEGTTKSVWENQGFVEVIVVRGNDRLLGPFTVDYTTADGSARAGVDYTAVSGMLRFELGETLRKIAIPLLQDPAPEPSRFFRVTLSSATGGIPLGTSALQINILDASPGGFLPLSPGLDARARIRHKGGVNVLTWEQTARILRADQAIGPWEELLDLQSPYASAPNLRMRYYRLESARRTELYVPSRYNGKTPLPLVIGLHGSGGNAAGIANRFRFQPLAESRGFLLCYPEGNVATSIITGERYWNAGDLFASVAPAIDDASYLRGLIEEISKRFAVDRKRIYLAGYSNGGVMAYHLGRDHSDLIAGIAVLEGATFLDPQMFRPSQPVHVLHVHGTADATAHYAGGAIITGAFPGALKSVQTVAQVNGCEGPVLDAELSLDLDLAVAGLDTTVFRYIKSPPGGSVELWTIHGATHFPTFYNSSSASQFSEKVIEWLLAHPKP